MTIEGMPRAKKDLSPLLVMLQNPLAQIIAAVGLLLSGVLGLVRQLVYPLRKANLCLRCSFQDSVSEASSIISWGLLASTNLLTVSELESSWGKSNLTSSQNILLFVMLP